MTLEYTQGFMLWGRNKTMKKLTIGQLAKQTQVSIDTLRYYEKEGIITPPERTESGYRQYSEDYIDRLIFIKKAQELGFSLTEIIELLSLQHSSEPDLCDEVQEKAKNKLKDIKEKMDMLDRMKQVIESLICACENRETGEECPILNSLSHRDNGKKGT